MSVEFDRGSPGKFDLRTLSRETLDRWTGRKLDRDAWMRGRRSIVGVVPLEISKFDETVPLAVHAYTRQRCL